MKKQPIALLIALTLVACGSPNDIVLGPEPLKQMAEQGDKFKKLSEEDRTLLVGFIAASSIGRAFGAEVKPITGRTVGEVLKDANSWREKMKAAEVEQKKHQDEVAALKVKADAERNAIADKIAGMVTIAVLDKFVLPKNYEAGRYSELLMIKYALENKSEKTIRQIKGRVEFVDATGDPVGDLGVDFDQPIAAGRTLKTDTGIGWKTNQFSRGSIEKIAERDFGSMKATFKATSIAFEGGEIIRAPE
jgi:hypothetical protein